MPEKSWMFPYKESFNASMVTKLPWARLGYDMFIFHRLQLISEPFWLRQELKKSQSASVRPALREYLKSTQREIREEETNQTSSYRRSLKYFVLL